MKRRILSLLTAAVLALSLVPTAALAEEGMGGEAVPSILQQETETGEVDALPSARAGETVVVSTADALKSALENADADQVTVVLEDDIVLTQTITMNGGSFILDMDGYAITYSADLSAGTAGLVDLYGSANLTVTGDGEFTFDDAYIADDSKSIGYIFRLADNAQLIIENGTYYAGLTCVQVGGSSGAEIRDGTFSAWATYDDRYWILNKIDNSSTSIEVSGGTFENYDPSNSDTENPTDNFCAEGYATVQDGENYVVVPFEDAAVARIDDAYYLTLGEAISAAEAGGTVTLLDDVDVNEQISIEKDLVLDLGNHILTNSFDSSVDSKGEAIFSMVTKADVTIQNGTYVSDSGIATTRGICESSGDLTIENATISCNGINVCNYADNGTLTITDSEINGSYAVGSFADKSTVNISGSELNGTTCGLYNNGSYYGLNMTVSNTSIVGGADGAEDVTGVYISGSQTTTDKNGGVNQQVRFSNCTVSGGTGIEIKFTDLTLENCTVSTTSDKEPTFEQYNNGATTTGFAVVATDNTMKPDSPAPGGSVTISGGDYTGLVGLGSLVDLATYPDFKECRYEITGGYFTSDPSDYVATGYYMAASDRPGYSYMVTDEAPTAAPVVVTEDVAASVVDGANMTAEDKVAVEAVMDSASVSGVSDALTASAKNEIVGKANISDEELADPDKTIVVEIGVSVTATSADLSGDNATVTYQVTPTATVSVDGEKQNGEIAVPNGYLNGRLFTVRLPLPEGLEPKEVMHIADDGSRERFTGNALTIGNGWVEVRISHFSQLIVNAKETVAAKIGDAEYGTLQEAVSAARSGDTIVLQANCSEPVTISGKSVTIDRNGHDYNANLVLVGSRCEKAESGDRIIVTYTAPSSSSGSSSEPSYSPVMDVSKGGSVKVNPRTPGEGDEVTITVDPDAGYEVDEVIVTDRSGREVDVTAGRDGTYTFEQPKGRVTITVTFARTGGAVSDRFSDVPGTYWAADEIAWAYENGYMNGTGADTFAPGASISRQQIWMILARMAGQSPADMAEARAWAMQNGISDGTAPGGAVTRQQLVALLYRYAQMMGYANEARVDLSSFPDAGSVASYAVEPMQWSVANSIVGGTTDGTLNPTGTATRAQFAVILYRFQNAAG